MGVYYMIAINPEKAKDIWRNKWRAARAPILATLDVQYMRAIESGDQAAQQDITAKKQALRDVTSTLLPDDPEQIKEIWPDCLNS
jgi:hypothetical protein